MKKKTTVSLWASMPVLKATSWPWHLLERLDSQFAFYHRHWWCHRRLFYRWKRLHAWSNGLALLIMAAGLIVGPVLKNTVLVACLAAAGTLVKGWNEFKKWGLKMQMSQFAYTTYAKTLNELRMYAGGEPVAHLDGFLIKMQTLDDMVTDFAPPVPDWCVLDYGQRYVYVPMTMFPDGIKGRGDVTPKTLECLVHEEGRSNAVKEEEVARRKEEVVVEEEVNEAESSPSCPSLSLPSLQQAKPPL